MTALSDSLAASQARAVVALSKAYVSGRMDRDAVQLALIGCGLADQVDSDQWFATLDVIREHGAAPPGEARPAPDNNATEAQWKLLRDLADKAGKTAPEGALTKAQASQVIEQIKAGTYNPDDWGVPF